MYHTIIPEKNDDRDLWFPEPNLSSYTDRWQLGLTGNWSARSHLHCGYSPPLRARCWLTIRLDDHTKPNPTFLHCHEPYPPRVKGSNNTVWSCGMPGPLSSTVTSWLVIAIACQLIPWPSHCRNAAHFTAKLLTARFHRDPDCLMQAS